MHDFFKEIYIRCKMDNLQKHGMSILTPKYMAIETTNNNILENYIKFIPPKIY